jgi:hypothetical protein
VRRLLLSIALTGASAGLSGGCDKLWSLQPVPEAPADSSPDVALPDAPPNISGCADATREGFADLSAFPMLAACSGAWSVAGLRPEPAASCNRAAGNDGTLAGGVGCTATDLCAAGWHVCRTKLEVYERLPIADRTCTRLAAAEQTLFVTAQSGNGGSKCDAAGTDDVFGCGTYGLVSDTATCAPLDRNSDNMCFIIKGVGGWECLDPTSEVTTIRKSDPTAGGGVLCCRDAN